MKHEISSTVRIACVQHSNGEIFIYADHFDEDLPVPNHFRVLDQVNVPVSFVVDSNYDPGRAYPEGKIS